MATIDGTPRHGGRSRKLRVHTLTKITKQCKQPGCRGRPYTLKAFPCPPPMKLHLLNPPETSSWTKGQVLKFLAYGGTPYSNHPTRFWGTELRSPCLLVSFTDWAITQTYTPIPFSLTCLLANHCQGRNKSRKALEQGTKSWEAMLIRWQEFGGGVYTWVSDSSILLCNVAFSIQLISAIIPTLPRD